MGLPRPRPVAPSARPAAPGSPLLAYRWEQTDRALADQLAIEREGYGGTVEPGHGDLFVVPSWQPFSARSESGSTDPDSGGLDLFRFSDSPVFEALKLSRTETTASPTGRAASPR